MIEAKPKAIASVTAYRRASFADKKLMRPSGRFLFAEVRYYCREKLTPKQERFCEEYLIDLNATQAAIRAGYAESSAGRNADRMMKNNEIQKKITELRLEQSKRTGITADRVLGKLEEIAFSNKNSTAQMKALELLGKHLGLWEKPTAENDEALSKLDEVLGKIEGGF